MIARDDLSKKKALSLLIRINEVLTANNVWFSLAYGSALGAVREHGFIAWDRDVDIVVRLPDYEKMRQVLIAELGDEYNYISSKSDNTSCFDTIQLRGIPMTEMHIDIYPLIGGPSDLKKQKMFQKKINFYNKFFNAKCESLGNYVHKWKIPLVIACKFVLFFLPKPVIRNKIDKLLSEYDFDGAEFLIPVGNNGKLSEFMEREMWLETSLFEFEGALLPAPKNFDKYLKNIYGLDYLVPKK